MRFKVRYGRAHLLEETPLYALTPAGKPSPWTWRPTRVVDDLLGVMGDKDFRFVGKDDTAPSTLERVGPMLLYLPTFFPDAFGADPDEAVRRLTVVENWWREFIAGSGPEWLAEAAKEAAAEGKVTPRLAEALAHGVRRLQDGVIEVDSPIAFGAWALVYLLEKGIPFRVETCPNCRRPWLADSASRYCERPTFEGGKMTCRSHEATARYKRAHGDFHRQRRRLYDRMKRGTLAKPEYDEWLAANRPGPKGKTWVSFEDWNAGKRPKQSQAKRRSRAG